MEAFERLDGIVVPIDRPNVDTDAIIPKQFLKSIKRSGFGPNLFDEWRYLDKGEPDQDNSQRPLNPDFVLNQARYKGASILLARDNFGCGSSREHAPWALHDFGIRALIAPSYADIFFGNSCKNGLLPITLPEAVVDQLFDEVAATPGYRLAIDLEAQTVTTPSGAVRHFDFHPGLKERLLEGLDDIGVTLQFADDIKAYEARRMADAPWLFV
ncbi:MAG: 3-isopropylmalate dehydratase small subunit [Gammaproteobacteria bacterium]|nr:3-isopropylmalate dehydratase small subunit [Gammaproteobacteria bacterium]MCP5201167.1 3-isopropylmalate dehydratase small subunit [Gammaproteobacteria bacterium]